MRVQLLGELEAAADEGALVEVRGVKQRTLLALLALHRRQTVSVDRLVDAIWGDKVPGNPANALQAQVAQVRRVLEPGSIVTHPGGYLFAGDVALFVGSFVIHNTFSILVAQRSREHALRRAIGASRRQILGAVITRIAGVGLIAVVAGIAGFGPILIYRLNDYRYSATTNRLQGRGR